MPLRVCYDLADVEREFAGTFQNLQHDFQELKHVTDGSKLVSTIETLDAFATSHNITTNNSNTRIEGVSMAVEALVVYVNRASLAKSLSNWQFMLWGSIAISFKVLHSLCYSVDQALQLVESITLPCGLLDLENKLVQSGSKAEFTKKNIAQIVEEIALTFGQAIVRFRGMPRQDQRQRTVRLVCPSEFACFGRASHRIEKFMKAVLDGSYEERTTTIDCDLRLPYNNTTEEMVSPRFFGREAYFPRIKDLFKYSSRDRKFHLALHGLPGVGKTQLALRYAYEYKQDYDVIIFMTAVTKQNIQVALARAAACIMQPNSSSGLRLDSFNSILSEIPFSNTVLKKLFVVT